jgi:hypothetical protein
VDVENLCQSACVERYRQDRRSHVDEIGGPSQLG